MHRLLLLFLLLLSLAACAAHEAGPVMTGSGVRFTLTAPGAASVAIAGSFNHWREGQNPLSGPDKRGNWSIDMPLPPGRYEYRFVLNGRDWVLDPAAPSVDDGLGGRNSIIDVPGPEEK